MGELGTLIERILGRLQGGISCDAMLQDGNGQRLTYGALRTRFDRARKTAKVDFQFRDHTSQDRN